MFRSCTVLTLICISFGWALTFANAQTSTPPSPNCASRSNTTCDECLQIVTCLWCISTQQCIDYPVRTILPSHSLCPLSEARWGLCWLNFQTLIISTSVLAGVILIAIFACCCCCCCCKGDRTAGDKKEDAKAERQAQARKYRQEERRTEMKTRHDEIRQKYGLAKGNPYSRMENN